MSKIKLTKGALKKQRDQLKQFKRYLPTLQLKKQQLQMKILEARKVLAVKEKIQNEKKKSVDHWVGLLGESDIDLSPWVVPVRILKGTVNVAGANVPVFEGIEFKPSDYDYYEMPLWVDSAIEDLKAYMEARVEVDIVKQQIELLQHELRVTTQRVNLFEKVKIPECMDNIRVIRIYLGDQQANAVGIGKVAKKKVEEKGLEAALVA